MIEQKQKMRLDTMKNVSIRRIKKLTSKDDIEKVYKIIEYIVVGKEK